MCVCLSLPPPSVGSRVGFGLSSKASRVGKGLPIKASRIVQSVAERFLARMPYQGREPLGSKSHRYSMAWFLCKQW